MAQSKLMRCEQTKKKYMEKENPTRENPFIYKISIRMANEQTNLYVSAFPKWCVEHEDSNEKEWNINWIIGFIHRQPTHICRILLHFYLLLPVQMDWNWWETKIRTFFLAFARISVPFQFFFLSHFFHFLSLSSHISCWTNNIVR